MNRFHNLAGVLSGRGSADQVSPSAIPPRVLATPATLSACPRRPRSIRSSLRSGGLAVDTSRLVTERLDLRPITAAIIAAFIAADADRLVGLTGATFPHPLRPPPLFADDLPALLAYVQAAPATAWPRLLVHRETGEAVGVAGLAPPAADGSVEVGYAIYPEHEGHGYATEATGALVEWALTQPGVQRVVATIPLGHGASRRVAEEAGLVQVGSGHDAVAGEVLVYEVRRAP
jgi:[ribosomal protein S5]-alanine N-acetyltransferase